MWWNGQHLEMCGPSETLSVTSLSAARAILMNGNIRTSKLIKLNLLTISIAFVFY